MACYRCSNCSIDFPTHEQFARCLACDEVTSYFSDIDADKLWNEKVIAIMDARTGESMMATPLPIPNVDAPITFYSDRDWIPHEDLIKAGYRCLEDFQVVRIRNRFYELQAHIGRTLTHGIRGGAWWVEQIDPDVTYDLPVLSEAEYAILEEQRGAKPFVTFTSDEDGEISVEVRDDWGEGDPAGEG